MEIFLLSKDLLRGAAGVSLGRQLRLYMTIQETEFLPSPEATPDLYNISLITSATCNGIVRLTALCSGY